MVKTVITVDDYGSINGGIAKVAIEGALALSDVVEESILFCAVNPVDERLYDKGIRVVSLNQYDILNDPNRLAASIRGIWNIKAKREFKKLLLEKNPKDTIIHVHSWTKAISCSIFKIADKMGFKIVLTIHDYFLVCPNGGLFNYRKNKICDYKSLSLKCITCNCDSRNYFHKLWRVVRQFVQNHVLEKRKNISYIFISEFSRNILEEHQKFNNYYMINNPIEVKNRLKVNVENNNIYLYIGRLSEEKGVRIFCQAVTDLNLKGTVVGDGYLLNTLKAEYTNIHFTGWQNYDGVRDSILKARCLVFPSLWYEVSPLTIPEAFIYGLPCVVSDRCAGRDLVDEFMLFNVLDLDTLKEKLLMLEKNDVVKKIGDNIYNSFKPENYSSKLYIENIINVYNEILNKEHFS